MLEEKLISIIAELLNVSPQGIDMNTKTDEMETWDSLATINIALAIEAEFDLSLTPEQMTQFTSVQNIYDVINESAS